MPFVDFQSAEDYVSLYYKTNSLFSNVGGFKADRPTILIIHPMFLSTDWLQNQFSDNRLYENFNLIAFDTRTSGKSECRSSGKHDSWVEAADLAFCAHALHLPPAHILACEGPAIMCAMRFAILFPEKCLSLSLCNIPAPTELKWVFNAYDELLQSWCFAPDLETFEHQTMEAVKFLIGSDCDPDLMDDIIAWWEMNNAPQQRVRVVEEMNVLLNRSPLTSEMHRQIKHPVLIIHGDRHETCPIKYAEKLQGELANAEGGAVLYPVKGGAGSLAIVPSHASIMNQVFAKFLARLPHHRSDIKPPEMSLARRMTLALGKLAELTGDPSFATRDPTSALSFSCLSREVVQSQIESLKTYARGATKAFSPVGPDGRPHQKYSERKQEHWFHGGKDGISYADSFIPPNERQRPEQESKHQAQSVVPLSDPVSSDLASQGRLRRATISPSSVDKHVIKGSMAKVVGAAQATSLQRLLK